MSPTSASRPVLRVVATGVACAALALAAAPALAAPGINSPIRTIYLIQEAHLDIGFTATQDVVAAGQKTTIDAALTLADANADYIWNVESLWQLQQWMIRSTPTEIQHLVDVARRGQINLMAGYANMHSDAVAPEENARFFTYADSLRRAWNLPLQTCVQDDVPGFTWGYPSTLRRSGVKYLLTGCNTGLAGGTTIPRRDYPFYWVGPEGDSVLTWPTMHNYLEATFFYGLYNTTAAYDSLAKRLPEWVAEGYPYDAILVFAATGDNGNASISQTSVARQWNAAYDNPKIIVATPEQFFQHLQDTYGDAHPVYRGDWGGFWDSGALNTPHSLLATRRAHDSSREGHSLASVSAILGLAPYPASTDRFVREQMLLFDEHSGGGAPWPNMMTTGQARKQSTIAMNYGLGADSAATLLRDTALSALTAQVSTSSAAVIVWNTLSWPRTGAVRIALTDWATVQLYDPVHAEYPVLGRDASTGSVVFVAREVPGMGYAIYQVVAGPPAAPRPPDQPSAATIIENEALRVTVDATSGVITSLYDKLASRELVDPARPYAFNGLIRASNTQATFAIWNEMALGAASIVATEAPPEHTLRITRAGSMMPTTVLTLYDGIPSLQVTDTIDRAAMRYVTYDIGFDFYDIPLPFQLGSYTAYIDWQGRPGVPVADNLPGTQIPYFVTHHGGEMNEGAYGVRWASPDIMVWEWNQINNFGATFAPGTARVLGRLLKKEDEAKYKNTGNGPLEVEPGQSPQITYRFALGAHGDPFDPAASSRFGWETATPLRALAVNAPVTGALPAVASRLLTSSSPSAQLSVLRPSDIQPGRYIARLANTTGLPLTTTLAGDVFVLTSAERTDLVESQVAPLAVIDGAVTLTLTPWEIASVRVGVSLRPTTIAPPPVPSPVERATLRRGTGELALTLSHRAALAGQLADVRGRVVARYTAPGLPAGTSRLLPREPVRLAAGIYFLRLDGEAPRRLLAF